MIKKYLAMTLCITTVLNSISFAMDSQPEPHPHLTLRYTNGEVILSVPFEREYANAFYQQYISPIAQQNGTPLSQKVVDSAAEGFKKGFSQYCEDTQYFLKLITKGELFNLSTETIQAGLRSYLETTIDSYLYPNSDARERKQLDPATLGKIFSQIREKTYWILLLGGFFNNKKVVYVKERGVQETHYDITTNQSAFFLEAIIPSFVPMRGLIISLAKNNYVNNFFLRRIDELFAHMVIEFYSKISNRNRHEIYQQLNDAALKKEPSLTGTSTIRKVYKPVSELTPEDTFLTPESALNDTPPTQAPSKSTKELPSLTKQEQSLSAIWNYLEPYMAHYIRAGIIALFEHLPTTVTDKIGGTALYHFSKFASEYSTVPILATSYMAYYGGEALTSIPYVDGLVAGGATLWALNGVFKAALPASGQKAAQTIQKSISELYSEFLLHKSHQWIPLSQAEHLLFNLPQTPSDDHKAFFREDYEAQANLYEASIFTAVLKDLQSIIESLPLISQLTSFAVSNPSSLKLIDKGMGQTDTRYHDTVAQVKFYRIAATLYRKHQEEEAYQTQTGKIKKVYDYLTNNKAQITSLGREEQAFYDEIRAHPSFDFRAKELERLTQKYTWQSTKDKEDHLIPALKEQSKLAKNFALAAFTIVEAIDTAAKNLQDCMDNVDETLKELQLALPFSEFMETIEAINDKNTRMAFFEQKPSRKDLINILPFQLLKNRFSDLYANHPTLVNLVRETSLGANLGTVQQLELAQQLAKNPKAVEIIQNAFKGPYQDMSAEEFENRVEQDLWKNYQTYTKNYLAQFYAMEFINEMGDQYFAALPSTVTMELQAKITPRFPLEMLIFNEQATKVGSAIHTFKQQLSEVLTDGKYRAMCYGFIYAKIKEKLDSYKGEMPTKKENSGQSSRWFVLGKQSAEVEEEITLPTILSFEKRLTSLADIEVKTLQEDGFDAFIINQVINSKLAQDPFIYDGSAAAELTRKDMKLLAKHFEKRRLSHINSSDDRRLIEAYHSEVRQIIVTHFPHTVSWTYNEILEIIRKRNSDLIKNISLTANPSSDGEQSSTSEHDQ
jgi:hypothetical protein